MAKLVSCQGLTAVVTGASSGLGRLLALRLAPEGARVALVARRAPELEAVAGEITRAGGEALVVPCDVADREQVLAAAGRVAQHFAAIDLLVCNAGYGHHRRFADWDIEDMERMMRVNYLGAIYWMKAVLPQMIERARGWIVIMASLAGKIGVPEESGYVASKFALVGLAEALAVELEDDGVHVLAVCPAAVRTEFFDAEALARMPPVAKRTMLAPETVVDATMRALAAGKHEITVPRRLATAYLVKAIAPEFMRRSVKRSTIDALAKAERAQRGAPS